MSYSTNDPKRKKAAPRWALISIVGGAAVIIVFAIVYTIVFDHAHFF